jgi:hypothetical protein
MTERTPTAHPGDLLVVDGHTTGDAARIGEIVEVIAGEREHYRVRWEDGRESILYPGDDAHVRQAAPRR